MKKLITNGVILLLTIQSFLANSVNSFDLDNFQSQLPLKSRLTVFIDWVSDSNQSSDSADQPNWTRIFKLFLSQTVYNLILHIWSKINNGFLTLAIGLAGLTTALIALIVAYQANWKIARYEFKSAERRRRDREIEQVHLKIYEQVIYGDRHDPNICGQSMEKLIRNK